MSNVTVQERQPTSTEVGNTLNGFQAIGDDRRLLMLKARVLLTPAVRQLPRRDRDILRALLFEGRTQANVSAELDMERADFSLLVQRILDDLRSGA